MAGWEEKRTPPRPAVEEVEHVLPLADGMHVKVWSLGGRSWNISLCGTDIYGMPTAEKAKAAMPKLLASLELACVAIRKHLDQEGKS